MSSSSKVLQALDVNDPRVKEGLQLYVEVKAFMPAGDQMLKDARSITAKQKNSLLTQTFDEGVVRDAEAFKTKSPEHLKKSGDLFAKVNTYKNGKLVELSNQYPTDPKTATLQTRVNEMATYLSSYQSMITDTIREIDVEIPKVKEAIRSIAETRAIIAAAKAAAPATSSNAPGIKRP